MRRAVRPATHRRNIVGNIGAATGTVKQMTDDAPDAFSPSAAELVAIGRTLAEDPRLRAQLDELDRDSAAFLAENPPLHFAPRPKSRATPMIAPWVRVAAPLGLALAAATFLTLRVPSDPERPSPDTHPKCNDAHPKGVPTLYIHRNTGSGIPEALPTGARGSARVE